MKTNILLMSAVLACSSLSWAVGGTSRTQTGTGNQPTMDNSEAVYDQTINPDRIRADRKSQNTYRQNRVSTDTNQSNIDRAKKDTDSSGHKSDTAPVTRE